jgi:hypothetical protein
VCECDLRGDVRVVVADVGERVVQTVFELDIHPDTELLGIERRCVPIDPDLFADHASVVGL